ncbi:MAG: hypothetical protein AB7K71_14075 [Polyangiaceae bacterium]
MLELGRQQVMNQCIAALSSSACDDLPDACNGVADAAPAIAWCEQFITTYCSKFAGCDFATQAECRESVEDGLDCSLAIGVAPSGDQCLAVLEGQSCGELLDGLPPSCEGVVKLGE